MCLFHPFCFVDKSEESQLRTFGKSSFAVQHNVFFLSVHDEKKLCNGLV